MYTSTGDPLAGGILLMVEAVTMADFSDVEDVTICAGRCVGVSLRGRRGSMALCAAHWDPERWPLVEFKRVLRETRGFLRRDPDCLPLLIGDLTCVQLATVPFAQALVLR